MKPTFWIWLEDYLGVLNPIFPDKVPYNNRIREQIVIVLYLLVDLADVEQATVNAIPKGFISSKWKLTSYLVEF